MQVREKTGQSLTDPITNTQLKTYIGYTASDQDTYLTSLITAVRKQVEKITSLSAIEKTYQVFFNEYDSNDGWYTLPFAPVKSITSVQSNGSDIVYDESGMTEVRIYPYWSPDLFGVGVGVGAGARWCWCWYRCGRGSGRWRLRWLWGRSWCWCRRRARPG